MRGDDQTILLRLEYAGILLQHTCFWETGTLECLQDFLSSPVTGTKQGTLSLDLVPQGIWLLEVPPLKFSKFHFGAGDKYHFSPFRYSPTP